jgi:hypothetical protein
VTQGRPAPGKELTEVRRGWHPQSEAVAVQTARGWLPVLSPSCNCHPSPCDLTLSIPHPPSPIPHPPPQDYNPLEAGLYHCVSVNKVGPRLGRACRRRRVIRLSAAPACPRQHCSIPKAALSLPPPIPHPYPYPYPHPHPTPGLLHRPGDAVQAGQPGRREAAAVGPAAQPARGAGRGDCGGGQRRRRAAGGRHQRRQPAGQWPLRAWLHPLQEQGRAGGPQR